MNRGEAASFAELVKRHSVMVASDLMWHVKGCRRLMTKCHSCQLALLRATIHCRNRLEEKKAPVEKVVEKVTQVVVPVAADPVCGVQALHGAYQAGWHDRDVEIEQLEHLLSISDRRVKLLQHDIERLKEQIEDLQNASWELEMKEEA
jgi:hypothetical protein